MAERNTQRPLRALLPFTNLRPALERSEREELVGAQADRRRCEILLEMRYRGGPRNGQHGGGALEQPGHAIWLGLAPWFWAIRTSGEFGLASLPAASGYQGIKAIPAPAHISISRSDDLSRRL